MIQVVEFDEGLGATNRIVTEEEEEWEDIAEILYWIMK